MRPRPDVEELLRRFSPRPIPAGLRDRTIQATGQRIRERRLLTPAWGWIWTATLALLFLFVLVDWRISAGEQNRLAALLDLPAERDLLPESQADRQTAELLANLPDMDPLSEKLVRHVFLHKEREAGLHPRPHRRLTEEIHEY